MKKENIIGYVRDNVVSLSISIIFVLIFVLDKIVGNNIIYDALSGSGFHQLNGEVYRIITASFLHANAFHLAVNIIALLCVGSFLERKLGSKKFLFIYAISDLLASLLFYSYMRECVNCNGSSIVIYALFAVLLVLWLRYPKNFPVEENPGARRYIIVFFFAGNMIIGNEMAVIIHAFGFSIGLLIGMILMEQMKRELCSKDL